MTVVTRFAPSPTGDLHIGHAYSAVFAHQAALRAGGRFLVRVEDIDGARCHETYLARNLEDLAWLGLRWETPVLRQSERLAHYRAALARLEAVGVTYPCFCTRKEIQAEIAAAAGAPHGSPTDGADIYPGRCRALPVDERQRRLANGSGYAIRLDSARAQALAGPLDWTDRRHGAQTCSLAQTGDVVLARKDLGTGYHLAVVVDDAAQGVTLVTRGDDLFEATHIHRMLYALLDLAPPTWHHHPLCRDAEGRRLAKRADGLSIRSLRQRGLTPEEVLAVAEEAAAP